MQNYEMMIVLSSYIDSKIIEVENDEGEMEEGIFIPIDKNAINVDRKTKFVTSWCYVTERAYKTWSHYLKMKVDKPTKEKMEELGMQLPYMGYMRVNRKKMFRNQDFSSYNRVKNIQEDE